MHQNKEIKEIVQFYLKNNYLLMDEEQENSSAFSQDLLAIEENSETAKSNENPDDAEARYKILKDQRRLVKARENRVQ